MADEAVRQLKPDGTLDTSNDLVQVDQHGDPLAQGTKMLERESYERVIEGLKMSADAAAHLAREEPEARATWRDLARKLDQVRRACVQHAGIGLVMKQKETNLEVSGAGMSWRDSRKRFRDGLEQAAGGCRQLATCFRMDFGWVRVAMTLESMLEKTKPKVVNPNRPRGLLLPGLGG